MKTIIVFLSLSILLTSMPAVASRCWFTFSNEHALSTETTPQRLARHFKRTQGRSVESFLKYLTFFERMLKASDISHDQKKQVLDSITAVVLHILRPDNIGYFNSRDLDTLKGAFTKISSNPLFNIAMGSSPLRIRRPLFFVDPLVPTQRQGHVQNFYQTYGENIFEYFRMFFNANIVKLLASSDLATPQPLWARFELHALYPPSPSAIFFRPDDYLGIARLVMAKFPGYRRSKAFVMEKISDLAREWWDAQKAALDYSIRENQQIRDSMTALAVTSIVAALERFSDQTPQQEIIDFFMEQYYYERLARIMDFQEGRSHRHARETSSYTLITH